MPAPLQNPSNANQAPLSSATARIVIVSFILIWSILAFFLSYLHWLNAFYAAMLLSPPVATVAMRLRRVRRDGWRRLPRGTARSFYFSAIAIWFSLFVLLYSVELWRGKWIYARLARSEQAKGNRFNPDSLVPPTIPDETNLCATPLLHALVSGNHESTLLDRDEHKLDASPALNRMLRLRLPNRRFHSKNYWFRSQFTDLESWHRSLVRDPDFNVPSIVDNSAASQVFNAFASFNPIIDELHEAAQERPQARWNLRYERGWYLEVLTHQRSQTLQSLIQILALRASASLQLGNSNTAFRETSLGLRLIGTLQSETSAYTQTSRIAMLTTIIQPIWEGLSEHRWQTEHLDQFRDQLSDIDLVSDAERITPAQGILQMDMWDELNETFHWQSLLRHRKALLQNNDGAYFWVGLIWQLHPRGWSYQNKVDAYRWFNQLNIKERKNFKPVDPLSVLFIVPKFRSLSLQLEGTIPMYQVVIQMVGTACALEQHRLEYDTYPPDLAQLNLRQAELRSIQSPAASITILYKPMDGPDFILYPNTQPAQSPFGSHRWDYVWRQGPRQQ